ALVARGRPRSPGGEGLATRGGWRGAGGGPGAPPPPPPAGRARGLARQGPRQPARVHHPRHFGNAGARPPGLGARVGRRFGVGPAASSGAAGAGTPTQPSCARLVPIPAPWTSLASLEHFAL